MRILVTGGAGFIGSHVADACLARGHDVLVLDDLSGGRRENVPDGARFVTLDIRDGDAVAREVAAFRPDAISHQAAQVSVSVSTREPQRDAQVNVAGTLHLLEAAVQSGVSRFVFASTGGAIYGELPAPERGEIGRPPRPLSPYACSKLAVEGYLGYYRHAHGLDATVLRYANVYGPRQDPHGEAGVVAIFTQRLLAGQALQVNARQALGDEGCIRDYVFVADVVEANVRALEGRIAEPMVNVGTGVETTTRDLATRLARAIGVTPTFGHGPRRAGDVERSVLAPWSGLSAPVTLDAGLADTVSWFRARSPGAGAD
jgi:UDP-glucose 4-epimerase